MRSRWEPLEVMPRAYRLGEVTLSIGANRSSRRSWPTSWAHCDPGLLPEKLSNREGRAGFRVEHHAGFRVHSPVGLSGLCMVLSRQRAPVFRDPPVAADLTGLVPSRR
jgi:hypothetical protein